MASTSSFTEGASVFGGQSNLLQSLETIFSVYKPRVVAVHTTCLSETIGDDIPQIIAKAKEEGKIPDGAFVIHANTPSYVGSHVTGFSTMVKSMVDYFAEPKAPTRAVVADAGAPRLNIIPGWVEPADMREIKRIATAMGIQALVFPDTSGITDAPFSGRAEMFPAGGVSVEALATMGDARATVALGPTASAAAASALELKCDVPHETMELPIGLSATDRFVDALRRRGGVQVPAALEEERGQLLDVMSDMHQYLYQKRVALFGDPDQLVALTEFLMDLDMDPVYIVTGTPTKKFEDRIRHALKDRADRAKFKQGATADMFLLHQWIKNESVDLLIGNTYGKYIARDEDVPFLRLGFPVLDRIGHVYFPTVGYRGALRLLEKMLDLFLDRQDRDAPEESFELVM